jgi:predicted DCC family thiol-disulfide oxidoreductase YuxK
VPYVIRHDRRGLFRFASLQSGYAKRLGIDVPLEEDGSFETMLVLWKGEVLRYSDAALTVLGHLDGWHRILRVFRLIPRVFRDTIYKWIARKRYLVFGRADRCELPTPEQAERMVG